MPSYRTTVRTPWSQQRAFHHLADLEHVVDSDPGVKRPAQLGGSGVLEGTAA